MTLLHEKGSEMSLIFYIQNDFLKVWYVSNQVFKRTFYETRFCQLKGSHVKTGVNNFFLKGFLPTLMVFTLRVKSCYKRAMSSWYFLQSSHFWSYPFFPHLFLKLYYSGNIVLFTSRFNLFSSLFLPTFLSHVLLSLNLREKTINFGKYHDVQLFYSL